jgi:hypothetical protein
MANGMMESQKKRKSEAWRQGFAWIFAFLLITPKSIPVTRSGISIKASGCRCTMSIDTPVYPAIIDTLNSAGIGNHYSLDFLYTNTPLLTQQAILFSEPMCGHPPARGPR